MIVGTAGHIDHGKTTLTRALTGVDTDRLKEEKRRGISIELGYAYTPLPNGDVLGLIDVPGHEKLIHTMAAGASGIDYALLVIAADDGIMPQTREHLTILELLGVKRGVVALTKVDRADATRIALLVSEIAAMLAQTSLAGAAIFLTQANQDGDAGVAQLKQHLLDVAQQMAQRTSHRLFRLAIDRVFNLTGHGLFVAGTASSGSVTVGDTLCLAPSGITARVRSIHAQNRPVETGHEGQRLSLNLVGVDKQQVSRGDWAVAAALAECSDRVDVDLHLLDSADLTLKPWSQVHVHLGATHRIARVLMLSSDSIEPGERTRAQLVFDAPVHTVPGEHFVLRNAQALRTIAGGRVLNPFGAAKKRRSAERMAWLDALSQFLDTEDDSLLIENSRFGVRRSLLTRLTLRPAEHLEVKTPVMEIALRGDDAILIARTALDHLGTLVVAALNEFHDRFPDEIGPQNARLKRIVEPDLVEVLWRTLIHTLSVSGAVIQQGSWLRLPTHIVELQPQEQVLANVLLASLHAAKFDPPWVRDLAREQQTTEAKVRELLRKLALRGQAYQIVPDLFCHPQRLSEMLQLIAAIAKEQVLSNGSVSRYVDAAAFRDATG